MSWICGCKRGRRCSETSGHRARVIVCGDGLEEPVGQDGPHFKPRSSISGTTRSDVKVPVKRSCAYVKPLITSGTRQHWERLQSPPDHLDSFSLLHNLKLDGVHQKVNSEYFETLCGELLLCHCVALFCAASFVRLQRLTGFFQPRCDEYMEADEHKRPWNIVSPAPIITLTCCFHHVLTHLWTVKLNI